MGYEVAFGCPPRVRQKMIFASCTPMTALGFFGGRQRVEYLVCRSSYED
jgi:hypothetical protein